MVQDQKAPAEGVGKECKLDGMNRILQPSECLQASVKLSWNQPGYYIILEN